MCHKTVIEIFRFSSSDSNRNESGRWRNHEGSSPAEHTRASIMAMRSRPSPCRCATCNRSRKWSGGFCCPAPPAAAEFPSVARWVQPRSFWVMSGREAINYAARARASLSLALVSFEPFYGVLRPGEGIAFQHTSILVRPRQKAPSGYRAIRDLWWSRRVPPPGPLRLLHDTIYRHSRENPAGTYMETLTPFIKRAMA